MMKNPVRLLSLMALASGTPVDTITVKQKMIERAYEAAHIQIQRLKWKHIIFGVALWYVTSQTWTHHL
jgi:hypothetical protein